MAGHAISHFVPLAFAIFAEFVAAFASTFEAAFVAWVVLAAVLALAGAAFARRASRSTTWSRRAP